MKRRPAARGHSTPDPAFFSTDVAVAKRFYLDLNPSPRRRLVVVCGGLEHCTPDYEIKRSTFPFHSIEYVARGSGNLKLGGRTLALQPGRLFSYGPRVPHHISGNPSDPLVKYFVDFSGKGARELLRSCGLEPGRACEVFPANALQPLFDELIDAGSGGRPSGETLCLRLLECIALRISGAQAPMTGPGTHAFHTYQQCRQYIDTHSIRLRTLEQIASECHINDAYLCRLFRRFDHQSPYQYLLRLKMNAAAERLLEPGALVKQVAEEVGFPDPFHFSRVFRSILGLSPGEFRGLKRASAADD